MKRTYWPAGLLACFCVLNAGCEKEDPEHLANVARKLASRAGPVVDTVDTEWLQRFRTTPEPAPVPVAVPASEPGVEARVSARLRWEKSLADASIQVVANEGGIELKGTVANLAQKKRAVELAESTTGVDRVTESLEVDEQSP
jgi:osmotically-inducible protein OsmY